MDDVDLDLVGRELEQRVAECLHRTVHVGLDDDIEFLEVAQCNAAANLVEGHMLLCAQTQLALQLCTAVGDVLGLLLVFGDVEGVASLTSTCKSK